MAMLMDSPLPAQIAAEDQHGADAQAQRKETLVHGGGDGAQNAGLLHLAQIRHQIKADALGGTGQKQAVHRQYHHDDQQDHHHPFGDTLHALLQAEGADHKAQHHDNEHPHGHGHRLGQHAGKSIVNAGLVQPAHLADEEPIEIIEHPARHSGVKGHEHIVAQHGKDAVPVPFGPLGLQLLIGLDAAFAAGTANGKLHGQHRNAHHRQEKHIQQHKQAAAVLADHIGEAPHVADADGAPGTEQQKAQSGTEFFTLHNSLPLAVR